MWLPASKRYTIGTSILNNPIVPESLLSVSQAVQNCFRFRVTRRHVRVTFRLTRGPFPCDSWHKSSPLNPPVLINFHLHFFETEPFRYFASTRISNSNHPLSTKHVVFFPKPYPILQQLTFLSIATPICHQLDRPSFRH